MDELLNRIRKEIINIKEEIKEQDEGKKYIVIKCEQKGDDVKYTICPEISERLLTCRKFNLNESCLIFNLASLSDVFWELDLKTDKISYSKECLRLAGYSPDEVEGTFEEWMSGIHPEDVTGVLQNLEAHTKGEMPVFNAEYRANCKDGSYRWIFDRGKVVSWDKKGNPEKMIGMFIDFSLQKKLEDSLLKTLNREKELNELKTQFVSMASHEFRTPLSTMLMSVEALLSYRDKMTNEEIDKKVQRIRNKIHFLRSITEKTLNLTQLESGKIELSPAETDLNEFLSMIAEGVKINTENSHKIVYTGTEGPVKIKIDPPMIKEVINNLIYNSIKYSDSGSLVDIKLIDNRECVEIQVADNGIGIPESDRHNIFEAFQRGSNVTGIRGAGLGLSLAKKFIRLHGGDITFESEVNRGTTFFIRLPKN